ncbi:hypothetical protein MUK42_32523 [Musa troglodytarum]|uniref:Uncharacterized protein n=1 Tax=Musa troglodytarum TaxID=320322 RepID=A0A9E7GMQ4_9LILI|nr:hypothetical protein MUK42_32523 [Musa troglodytarum]
MGWKHATCATRRASSPVVLPSRSKRAKGGRLVLRWRRRRLKLQRKIHIRLYPRILIALPSSRSNRNIDKKQLSTHNRESNSTTLSKGEGCTVPQDLGMRMQNL